MESAAVAEESAWPKMETMRLFCEREASVEVKKTDSFTAYFAQSLDSINSAVDQTLLNQGKLGKFKCRLREAEDEFVKVLAVKTRKEAKQMAIRDSISATRARIQQLERTLQVQRARRDEFAAFISDQSLDKENQGVENGGTQEAILWYNKVFGFHIEGGRGVKFTFNNINMSNPHEEYTFTIRHENDTYSLLACDPHLNDTKDLIHELNRTNGLFKFVRTVREKFHEVASHGILPQSTILHQESATISVSAPALSVSTERSESPAKENEYSCEVKRQSKKIYPRGTKQAPDVRRSPRHIKDVRRILSTRKY